MRRRRLKSRVRIWYRKRANRIVLFKIIRTIVVLLLVGGVIFGILHSPIFSIRSVEISNESNVNHTLEKEILIYARNVLGEYKFGVPGSTRYLFGKSAIEEKIKEQFTQLDDVIINRAFFNRWIVITNERKTFGTSCIEDKCFLIDIQGRVFGTTDSSVGVSIIFPKIEKVMVGKWIYGRDENALQGFKKITDIRLFLEEQDLFIEHIAVKRDSREIFISLSNGTGIWVDTNNTLYDTTRALYVIFQEIFKTKIQRDNLLWVDVKNPINIPYEEK